jgi:hypothetical protein
LFAPESAEPKVQLPPTPLKNMLAVLKLTPFVVTVLPVVVALKVICAGAVAVQVQLAAGSVIEP